MRHIIFGFVLSVAILKIYPVLFPPTYLGGNLAEPFLKEWKSKHRSSYRIDNDYYARFGYKNASEFEKENSGPAMDSVSVALSSDNVSQMMFRSETEKLSQSIAGRKASKKDQYLYDSISDTMDIARGSAFISQRF